MSELWADIKNKFKTKKMSDKSRKRIATETLVSCVLSILFLATFNVILDTTNAGWFWLGFGFVVLFVGWWCVRSVGNILVGTTLLIIGSDIAGVMIVLLF